jgi:uncharacterized membrane protein YkvA (DUF1232 family)
VKQPSVQKLKSSIKQVFKQFRIMRRAVVHPEVPGHAKAVVGFALFYVVSPIQSIPNFIPIIGQMDDVLVVALGVKYLKRWVPQSVLEECENHVRKPPKSRVSLMRAATPLLDPKS